MTVIVLADVILVLFGFIAYLSAFPVREVTFKNRLFSIVEPNRAAKEIKRGWGEGNRSEKGVGRLKQKSKTKQNKKSPQPLSC